MMTNSVFNATFENKFMKIEDGTVIPDYGCFQKALP